MLFNNLAIYQNIISGIIAPHGITDLFHAKQNNHIRDLLSINVFCASSSIMLNAIHDPYLILDASFFISSIIHFRHDMPNIFPNSEYGSSLLIILLSIFYNHDIFFAYMLLSHVPHHYYMNRNIIKENIKYNLGVLFITTLSCVYCTHIFDIFHSSLAFDLSKGIVISHIVYEEMFIHQNNTNMSLIPIL